MSEALPRPSRRRVGAALIALLAFLALLISACGGAPAPSRPPTAPVAAAGSAAPKTGSAPLPVRPVTPFVLPDDAQWGSASAPVTIVEFADLECPYCARAQSNVAELANRYGPDTVRVVFKHYPLPMHPHARSAAGAARAVQDLAGSAACFAFISAVFADPEHLEEEDLARKAAAVGVEEARFTDRMSSPDINARIDADLAYSRRLGVTGTPHFFINGVSVVGAVPTAELAGIIDGELAAALQLRAEGISAAEISAHRIKANYADPPKPEAPPPDTAVWYAPVEDSATRGPADALVTIVEFGDLQCPFCKRVQPTLDTLRARYGADLRIVWKHHPLGFHARARAAATLAIEARKKLGDAGFWKAIDAVYASAPKLEDEDLASIAGRLGLSPKAVKEAIASNADRAIIDADSALADRLHASGVPHFLVNGHRISGAQPLESFVALVDQSLAEANALIKEHNVPRARVYEELQRDAQQSPAVAKPNSTPNLFGP